MPVPRVRITSQLDAQIRGVGLNPADLSADFQDWKSGPPDDHYIFGQDLRGVGSTYLYHAHMVPLNNAADLATWDAMWRNYQGRRKSDRYVFYANGGAREGFLLIAVIDDPGAHAIWRNRSAVQAYEKVAEDFCVFGAVP